MTMLGRLAAPPAARGCLDLDSIEALREDSADRLESPDAPEQICTAGFHPRSLREADASLAEQFWAGEDVVQLVHARAWVVEQLLLLAWKKLVPFPGTSAWLPSVVTGAVSCIRIRTSIC